VIPVSLGWHTTNVIGVVVALTILVAALVAWRRPEMSPESSTARTAAFGVVWFLVAISPVSNALFLSGVLLAERTLYLPSVGLAAVTGWLCLRLARDRPRGAWVLLLGALGLGSLKTWTRTPTWFNNPTVFAHLIGDNPHAGRSQWILGDEFLRLGSESSALRAYSASIGILGQDYQLLTEISKRLMGVQRYRTAEFLLSQARESDPTFPLAPALITLVRAESGDPVGTERYAREALGLYGTDGVRWHLLAWSLAAQGRWDEAAQVRARAEEESAGGFWQSWMYLAYVRRHDGDASGASAAIDSAWSRVATDIGRAALDSARMTEFGLPTLLGVGTGDGDAGVH
jgi:tetratricopeptide (TPR) repeat protein